MARDKFKFRHTLKSFLARVCNFKFYTRITPENC
jgi:hypothetical protein